MADTYSQLLRIRLQQTGANNNTWGGYLNSGALQLIEDAIAGRASITVASTDVTLTSNDGANDQSRMAVLHLQGAPGDTRSIIVPAVSKLYLIDNQTDATQLITTADGDGVEIASGALQQVYCNGTDVNAVDSADAYSLFVELTDGATVTIDCDTGEKFVLTMDGSRTLSFTNQRDGTKVELWLVQDEDGDRLVTWPSNVQWESGTTPILSTAANAVDRFELTYNDALNKWMARAGVPLLGFVELTDASVVAIDCRLGDKFYVTLAGNRALTLSNPRDGQEIELWLVQDAAGSRTISWPSSVRFASGTGSSLTSTANAVDAYRLTYNSDLAIWIAQSVSNAQVAGTSSADITISMNTMDVNLYALAGSPTDIVTLNVTVNTGVVIQSSNTGVPAIDTRGFTSGSTINITNNGYILGKGGRGGQNALVGGYGTEGNVFSAENGYAGGPAIYGPGAGRTLNLTNLNGRVWGGGGGGGGGGAQGDHTHSSAGGAGGGGAGNGDPGRFWFVPGNSNELTGYGGYGTTGPSGTYGAGGTGSTGAASGGNGGNGGDWGSDGSDGVSVSGIATAGYGEGGDAGKAVVVNSATVNFLSGGSSPNVKGAVS